MQVHQFDPTEAYFVARSTLDTVQKACNIWPPDVAATARRAASDVVNAVIEGQKYSPKTAAYRRCLRNAIANAIELAAMCDVALAHGLADAESSRCAARTLSMLGLSYQAVS